MTEPQPHILVVDDHREIRDLIGRYLLKNAFRVTTAESAAAARKALKAAAVDLVVLDIMMPGEDGLSLCRFLRESSDTPVILLTAMAEDTDRVVGLEIGADDYVTKPFNPRELLARIRAVLRRAEGALTEPAPRNRRVAFAGFVADLDARSIAAADGPLLDLTSAEFELLACFLERPKRVLSRDQLLDWTRGRSADPFDRTIDVSVSRLRRKLSAVSEEAALLIKTVRNGGYLLTVDVRPL